MKWNGDLTGISKTFETHGWTAFLKELTPPSLFDGLDSEKPGKRTDRSELLDDMYEIAELEERYQNGECGQYLRCVLPLQSLLILLDADGDDMIHWESEPQIKHSRRSVTAKRARGASINPNNVPGSAASAPVVARSAKKLKQVNQQAAPSKKFKTCLEAIGHGAC